ncbi:hypothetical protein M0811_02930 [Anaeramoeba ignava]|uniref:Uncharacterized protein n=1 Tax=Anaeramoeba ignava TaxID=1746090 RepID=A0A9Q0L986_ANAIG|nr:hypothetical protein M0811_02930 [Anaeramoeba ignava]
MKLLTTFLFLVILLSFSFASFFSHNCGEDTDPMVVQYYDFPDDFLRIDQPLTFSFNYSLAPGSSMQQGSTVTFTIWYQDFTGDPWMVIPADVCSISNQVKCPVLPGNYTWEETNFQVPDFPLGQWKAQILITNSTTRFICNEIYFTTNNGSSPYPPSCEFNSSYEFKTFLPESNVHFENSDVTNRQMGDWLQIGSLGSWGNWDNISFTSMTETPDNSFGNTLNASQFLWAVNATISEILTDSTYYAYQYSGNFWIGSVELDMNSWRFPFIKGDIVFVEKYLKSNLALSSLLGKVDVIPASSFPIGWDGPVLFGRLNPGKVTIDIGTRILTISKSGILCQCPVDVCGVCGGDGSTCQTSTSKSKTGIIAASVVVPVVVISVLIIVFVIYPKRKAKKKMADDIMNPNLSSQKSGNWTQIADIN